MASDSAELGGYRQRRQHGPLGLPEKSLGLARLEALPRGQGNGPTGSLCCAEEEEEE